MAFEVNDTHLQFIEIYVYNQNQASKNEKVEKVEKVFAGVAVWEKKPMPKNRTLGEEMPDNHLHLRPTIISRELNKYCRLVSTTLIQGDVLFKRLNDH